MRPLYLLQLTEIRRRAFRLHVDCVAGGFLGALVAILLLWLLK